MMPEYIDKDIDIIIINISSKEIFPEMRFFPEKRKEIKTGNLPLQHVMICSCIVLLNVG